MKPRVQNMLTSKLAFVVLPFSILATTLPLSAADGTRDPAPVTTTGPREFRARRHHSDPRDVWPSDGEGLTDQASVEVMVTKSLQFDYKAKQPNDAAKRLDEVRTVTERKSPRELE